MARTCRTCPDVWLPGCVAVADTPEKAERLIREAIEFHLEGMREDGDPIPEPTTHVIELSVEIPAA
jgi:predicted RNase H-like HicB family nuclease